MLIYMLLRRSSERVLFVGVTADEAGVEEAAGVSLVVEINAATASSRRFADKRWTGRIRFEEDTQIRIIR